MNDAAGDDGDGPMYDDVVVEEVELLTVVVVVVTVLDEQAVAGGDGVVDGVEEAVDITKISCTEGTKDTGPLVIFPVKVGIPDLIKSEVRLLMKEDVVVAVVVWSGIVWVVDVCNA